MADVSQGPGWWIASDGRWYPPHLHPSVVQAPPPPQHYPVPGPPEVSTQPAWSQAQAGESHRRRRPPHRTIRSAMARRQPLVRLRAWRRWGRLLPGPRVRIDQVLHLALAPWWKRLLAFLIDSMVIGVAGFFIVVRHRRGARDSNTSTTSNQPSDPGTGRGRILRRSSSCLHPFHALLRHHERVEARPDAGEDGAEHRGEGCATGGPIGFWRGVGRYAITVVFYIVLFIPYLIDNLSPLWDSRRQAWHDKVVHSVVVDAVREG